MGQSHLGPGLLQQPRRQGAGLVRDVVAGVERGIRLENTEEEKLSGFDYGLDVLSLQPAGSSATEARDPRLKRGPGKGGQGRREGPVGGTSAREEEIWGLPAFGSLKCWAWMCDPKGQAQAPGNKNVDRQTLEKLKGAYDTDPVAGSQVRIPAPTTLPRLATARVTSLVPRPSHLTNAGGNACGPTSWPGLQALII